MGKTEVEKVDVSPSSVVLATLLLKHPIPVIRDGDSFYAGWDSVNWDELRRLGHDLTGLAADVLQLPDSKFYEKMFERLGRGYAHAGISIAVATGTPPSNDALMRVAQTFSRFLAGILGIEHTLAPALVEQDELPAELEALLKQRIEDVLQERASKKIGAPMVLRVGEHELLVSGRHADKPVRQVCDKIYNVVARLEGYDRPARTAKILHQGTERTGNVAFDVGLLLAELRAKTCDNRFYHLTLRATTDAKGKDLLVLDHVGDIVPDGPLLAGTD